MTHRPRVIVATRLYSPEPAAASFRLNALVDGLADAGASVEVLTSIWGATPRRERARPGVIIRRAPVLRDAAGYIRGYLQYLSFDIPLAVRLLLARRPDAIVCEPPPTTGIVVRVAGALRRIPYVYYAADIWSEATDDSIAPRLVQRLLSIAENWALRGARHVLSVSPQVTARLAARGITDGVVTVGNGIDTSVFTPTGDGRPSFTPEGEAHPSPGPLLVYTGTASEVHGATIFVEAMRTVVAEVPGARMVFMGQGAEVDQMRSLAAELPPGTVEFLPRQPPAEVARWLRSAHVALASVRPGGYGFAFPSKAYAAAACGAPVVFAGAGPAVPLIEDNGLGIAVGYDVEAVAAAMIDQLRTPGTPEERARRAAWARDSASLAEVGRRAAQAVLALRAPA